MPNKLIFALFTVISCSVSIAAEYHPKFDPSQLKTPKTSVPNEVLVLATPHLSGLPERFSPKSLNLLIEKLETWRPQLITVESLSGMQCDMMRRYSARYAGSIKPYCWDPSIARASTGLDVPAATAEVDRLLASWSATPTPDQRRHLAATFFAAGDQASALVQWLRLPDSERIEQGWLNTPLVQRLNELREKRDETFQIAAPLAARLGLERVYPIDDHTADSADATEAEEKETSEIMKNLWDNPATAKRTATAKLLESYLDSEQGILKMYRVYNRDDQALLVYKSDFGAALKDKSIRQVGRGYVGYWETRNLRMVANIRDVLGAMPGKRTLSIVGASHKGYFEAYLNVMHDVKLINSDAVLK